ncbi:ABC transporter substrate-binding protein [Terrabacter carboxydivorans]|uniref:ABC transporter substrate-binding protein n=1 Tax=Terrabacter carboxydivorans TaxID=619730 RepID=A0ABP5ZQ60_9MICO
MPRAESYAGPGRLRRSRQWSSVLVACLAAAACAAPATTEGQAAQTAPSGRSWTEVTRAARGATVSLWMWGGDPKGNAYVDDVLTPAARQLGITVRRVPVADTKDAVNRVLSERQANVTDGAVDLVWVNGDNFTTGEQAGVWRCGWTQSLPNMAYTDPADPLLATDFGTPVHGCEVPWHKAQFVLAYNAAKVTAPPTSLEGVLAWARQHPGRFTYPAPPDFTGSVFMREVLYATAGGYRQVPSGYNQAAYNRLTPALWTTLRDLAPSLWRGGQTYPRDAVALDKLYADGQIDMTMTYGPATLTDLVANGTFPKATRVLSLKGGTVGNASFLAIPATSGHQDAAMVVANLALSPQQQAAKADPRTWGQFTVLDTSRLPPGPRGRFAELPSSPVVPAYPVMSKNAQPELSASWVTPLDDGWRRAVLERR